MRYISFKARHTISSSHARCDHMTGSVILNNIPVTADPYFSVCYLRASCPYEPSMPIGFTFIISRTSNSRSDMPIPNEICSAVLPSARKTDTNWEKARIATPFRDFARLMRTSLAVGRHAKRDSQRTTSHSKLVFWLFTRCRQKDNV